MSYISPIKIGYTAEPEEGWTDKIGKYMAGEVDNLVLQSCVKVGCHVDMDELEKALRYDRDQYVKGYKDGKRDAASPWHRVEDELPRGQELVIVAVKDTAGDTPFWFTQCGWITTDGEYWIVDNEICNYVVAWMPLPEPPKEDA